MLYQITTEPSDDENKIAARISPDGCEVDGVKVEFHVEQSAVPLPSPESP